VTVAPAGYFDDEPPPDVRVVVPCGSRPCIDSFQASSRWTDETVAVGGVTVENVPIIATPVVAVLKPPACAPITGRAMPPCRPS
jgi:hypothetical protein